MSRFVIGDMQTILDHGPAPECPNPFNLAAYVLGAAVDPDKPALCEVGHATWSYRDIRVAVQGAAYQFEQSGVQPDHKVLLRIGNSSRFPISFLALCWIGAVPIITSAALTQSELDRMVPQVRPDWMLAEDGIAVPTLRPPYLPLPDLTAGSPRDLPPRLGDPDAAGYIVFTSGTSALPKPVVHAHRAVWARRMMWADWYDLRETDRLYHSGAFNWTFTLGTGLLDPWAAGATAIVAPGQRPSFAVLAAQDVTLFAAAPGVFRQLLRTDPHPLPHLRRGLAAGDKLPSAIRQAWTKATGTSLAEAYGMTECSTFLSDRPTQAPGLMPQTGRRIGITDDQHIAIDGRDPGLMLGYLTDGAMDLPLKNGWFVTQDLGKTNGTTVQFLARTGGLLNAGGFRVSPMEIEDALSQYPAISDVAVAEVAVKENTTIIGCFYVSDQDVDHETVNRFAHQHLAPYKQPRFYQRVDALPRTANGKLDRRALPGLWRPE